MGRQRLVLAATSATRTRAWTTFLAHPWGHTPGGPPPGYPLPNDPVAAISSYEIVTLWLLGRPKEALAVADRGLRRTAELRFPYGPFSTAMLLSHLAIMQRLEGDYDGGVRARAAR